MQSGTDQIVDTILDKPSDQTPLNIPNFALPDKDRQGRPLSRGARDSIRFINVYFYERGGVFRVHAYDGQLTKEGGRHRITILSDQTTKDGAIHWAKEWVKKVDAAWEKKYGNEEPDIWSGDLPSTGAPRGSIECLILDRMETLRAELGDKNTTYTNYCTEARFILKLLGKVRLRRAPSFLTPLEITRMVEIRLRKLPQESSRTQTLRDWRYILKGVRGFPEECIKAIAAPKKKRVRGRAADPRNSDDFPFEDHELKAIIDNLPRASETVAGLHHIGSCGTMNTIDAVLAKWSHYDQIKRTGKARRKKTYNPFQYGLTTGLREWLKRRSKNRKPGDIYIFPEIVFTQRQLQDPDCNKKALSREEEDAVAAGARARACDIYQDYLVNVCGITRPGVSFRSYRHYNVSHLIRANVSDEFIKWLVGHIGEGKNLGRYIHPIPAVTSSVGRFLDRLYTAVKEGREIPVFVDEGERMEAFAKIVREQNAKFRKELLKHISALISQALKNMLPELVPLILGLSAGVQTLSPEEKSNASCRQP